MIARSLVLVLAVAMLLLVARENAASAPVCKGCVRPPVAAPAVQEREAARQLAEKHAPIIYLRNQRDACDTRGSPYTPVPVEFLFDVEGVVLMTREGSRDVQVADRVTAADLYGKDDTYYIDTPGNPRRPGCVYEQDYLARADSYPAVAYAHIARQEGSDGFALQYWLYYYFNHWNNTHEGDWEMVQLNFDGPSVADALSQEPTGIGYSQHGSGERGSWDDGKLTREGDRPVSFVAAGANANQFEPNIILGRGDNGTGFGCDDATPPNRRVPLEVRLMEEPTSANDEYAWLAFDGRWGERAPWEFNGPTGPNDKRAWTQPFDWYDDLRPSSIIVPSGDTIGPNAVNFFCDAVWYLSAPFVLFLRLPPVVLIAGVLVSAVGVVFVATRTQYWPPHDEPLRRRRRFGQMLSSALRLYRRNLWPFFAIGLLFVAAGVIEAGWHWLLAQTPLLDTITGFFSNSRGAELVLMLTLGTAASSLAYWLVLNGSFAALARLEEGSRRSAVLSYKDMLRKLPALAWARIKAIAIIALLAITIVGIPWALRHGIRWAFIESAMLLDGVPSRDARAHSGRTVDGRWWYTFGCLVVLALTGYITGPLIAFLLLFVSSATPYAINLASSIIFAALAPFVAICHAFLYFELIAEHESAPSEARGV